MQGAEKKKVCIIGAGVSGLITARVFLQDEGVFEVIVFEKRDNLGGVWHPSCTYPGLRTSSTKASYGYSDFPIPDSFDIYPTAQQMFQYFDAYAEKHKLKEHIIFGAQVTQAQLIESSKGSSWKVDVTTNNKQDTLTFDILIVASGLYSSPYFPEFKNIKQFKGTVIHTAQGLDENTLKNKRVLVIGAGKSGQDIATESAKISRYVTFSFRQPHWTAPPFLLGGRLPTTYCFFAKVNNIILPFYYDLKGKEKFASTYFNFILKKIQNSITKTLISHSGLPETHPLFPAHPFYADPSVSIAPLDFYAMVKNGKIDVLHGEVVDFVGDKGVLFSNGKQEEYDVIILATGYRTKFPFFDEATVKKLNLHLFDPEYPCLYRYLVPLSEVKNVAFVGYLNCLRNPTAYELGAHWLTEYFLGYLTTPSLSAMKQQVENRLKFMRTFLLTAKRGAVELLTQDIPYFNELMDDMKIPRNRTNNFVKEMFGGLGPLWYSSVREQKVAVRTNTNFKKFYFGFAHFAILVLLWFLWVYYF